MLTNGVIVSGGLQLPRYLARPPGRTEALPGIIMCHSFPFGPFDARHSASTFPEMMDRIANELGFAAMCFTFRGCGDSPGDFSLQGWVDDLRAAIDHMIGGCSAPIPVRHSDCASPQTTQGSADARYSDREPTSTTGRSTHGAFWSTRERSEQFARRRSRRTSTSGRANCDAFVPSSRRDDSRRDLCC